MPEGWKWQEADTEKELITGTVVTAAAVYIGADKDNYKNTAVIVSIIRKADSSGSTGGNTGSTGGSGNTGNTGNTGSNSSNTGNTTGNTGSNTGNTNSNTKPAETDNNNQGGNHTADPGNTENQVPEKPEEPTTKPTETGIVINVVSEGTTDGDKTTGNIQVEIQEKAIESAVEGKKNITITVDVSSGENAEIEKVVLKKDSIDAAKNTGKGLVIKIVRGSDGSSENYQVTIPVKQLKKITGDCDIAVHMEKASEMADSDLKDSISKTLAKSKTEEDKICVVSTAGDIAGDVGMKITVPAEEKMKIEGSSKIYVYQYNTKTGKLEEAAYCRQSLGADGTVLISAKAGTSYVLSEKKLKGKQVVTIKSQISAAVSKKSVKAGKTVKITVAFPETVSTKTKFATEKATVSYRSNHPKMASVSKTGVIHAKKKGTVTVTVTITLDSGQKITKKQKITIK